jgi:membrane-associated phospholipid phosphatase
MEQLPFSAFQAEARTAHGAAARRPFDFRMMPIYGGLALAWLVLLIAMPLAHVSVDVPLTVAFVVVCGLGVWAAACLRMRGLVRTATGIEAWALLNLSSLTGIIATYVAARYSAPLADHWMVAADRRILPGLDWRTLVVTVAHTPMLVHGANWVYASLQWQGSALILLCCLAGQAERCPAFVLRWMITLALTCAGFALLPCYGPDTVYALTHAEVRAIGSNAGWCAPPIMAWLRSAGSVRLDLAALDGIVTFPSFHAASATLFAWGFWSIRWARWPMLVLNLAMIAASVPIGGHYYVDVLAGVAIAGISIALPTWWSRYRARGARPLAPRIA